MKTSLVIIRAVLTYTNNSIIVSCCLCILLLCVAANHTWVGRCITADTAKITSEKRTTGCAALPVRAGRPVCFIALVHTNWEALKHHSQGICQFFKQILHSPLFIITCWKMECLY